MHGRMAEGLAEVMSGGTRGAWEAAGKAGGDGRGEECAWMWAPRNTMSDLKKY